MNSLQQGVCSRGRFSGTTSNGDTISGSGTFSGTFDGSGNISGSIEEDA